MRYDVCKRFLPAPPETGSELVLKASTFTGMCDALIVYMQPLDGTLVQGVQMLRQHIASLARLHWVQAGD